MPTGICQTCGTTAPIEWFITEAMRRKFEAILICIPQPVQGEVFHYMSLFRPISGRCLTPKKSLRLIGELRDLVAKGYVSVQGRVDRPCDPSIWATAMETMACQRHSLSLPMPNHRYLIKIAYDLADKADSQAEQATRQAEQNGDYRNMVTKQTEPTSMSDMLKGLTAEELARLPQRLKEKHGVK